MHIVRLFPVAICKKTWVSLRDSFRRALKKKRETKSGQAASKIKKWKFEDEMSFLLPFMQERDTCSNLKDVSDNDNEDEPNEDDEYDDKNNDRGDDRNDDRGEDQNYDRGDDRNDDKHDDKDDDVDEESHAEDKRKKKQKEINRKMVSNTRNKENRWQKQPETALAMMMKYLLDKKTAKEQVTPLPSAIDTFFSSIATTVKNFSPYYQNIAKSQIFSIITDLEMKQIMQPCFVSNTSSTQHHSAQMQSYHTGPHNVLRPLSSPLPLPSSRATPSPSPSGIATPIPSPSYDFPPIVLMPHLSEETQYSNVKM